MKIVCSSATDVGRRRAHNEDTMLVVPELGLYIVCDGMGGHAAGEVASALAASTVRDVVADHIADIRAAAAGDRDERRTVLDLLSRAVQQANTTLQAQAESNPAQRGMGTTLSLLLLVGERAFIAHVGDSRVYLYRNEQVHQVTDDHTILNEMVRAGRISLEDGRKIKAMNALTRAVGVYPSVEADTLEFDLLPGDIFLLCSDGLHNYFDDFDLRTFLAHSDTDTVADDLVSFANKRGGGDNIYVVALFIREARETEQTLRIRLSLKTLRDVPLFHYLSFAELLRVITVCELVEVTLGTVVIEENKPGDDFFVVVDGSVAVQKAGTDVAVLAAGRHFGEMALIDNRPRSATIVAREKALLIRVVRDRFFELLREDPVMAVKLLWNMIQSMSSVIRTMNDELPLLSTQPQEPSVEHPYRNS